MKIILSKVINKSFDDVHSIFVNDVIQEKPKPKEEHITYDLLRDKILKNENRRDIEIKPTKNKKTNNKNKKMLNV